MALACRVSLGIAGYACIACGGGVPLLHPAHVLPPGQVSAGAGASGQFVFGASSSSADRATRSTDPEQQFVEQAASNLSLAPGVAPWVDARAGIGGHNEGGITYTGRTARVDARHAFGDDTVAVSVGAGASAVLSHPGSQGSTTTGEGATAGRLSGNSNDLSAVGFGLDVPVIVGWRSTASVVQVWAGGRAGVERASGALALTDGTDAATVTATRWYGGGLVGFAVGLQPVWVAFELDAAYQAVAVGADFPSSSGNPTRREANLTGFTVAPAGAVVGKF